ncbi:MAG TPA: flagellar hook-basal body complex protein FliE [Acetobacteraceae bacterium]|jgi:flagellar hook-basal body complex protein FliE
MTDIPTIFVTPSSAAEAYGRVERGEAGNGHGDFGATLQRAMQGAVDEFHTTDAKVTEALTGGGNLTEVVSALARAQLTLQTATAVRDRVVQAYQDIMKMAI